MKYLLSLIILISIGCAKEEINPIDYVGNEETEQLILNKNEGELSENVINTIEMNRFISAISPNTIKYDASVPNKERFQVGKIIIGNPSDLSPSGFLREIESIQEVDNEIILTTINSNLFDAFKYLDIDAKYKTIGNSIKRDGSIKKTNLGFLPIEIGAKNITFDMEPSFGMSGDFIFELKIDPSKKSLEKFRTGIENLKIDFEVISSFYGTIEGESAIEELPIPLPFVLTIPIGEWIVTINSRLVVKAAVEITSSGGFKLKTTLLNEPFDIIGEINPIDYPTSPHINYTYTNAIESIEDLGFSHEFIDVQGSIETSVGLILSLQLSPYGLFEQVGSAYVDLKYLNFKASAETETVDDKLQATTKLDIISSLAIGTDLLEKIWEKANLWNQPPELEYETPELVFPLSQDVYCFPCTVQFNASSFDASCTGPNLDKVKMNFRVDSDNGSSGGYQLIIDNEIIDTYAYNQNQTKTISALRLKNYSDITLKDSEKTGCRLNFKVTNPCDLRVNCDAAPFKDVRDDQEYCFLEMADNKTWLASNLVYNNEGNTGVCHENLPDRCYEFGRYYSFNELNPTGAESAQGLCPSGYHVPSRAEWFTLLQAENNTNNRVPHLIAPFYSAFGDYPPEATNGFNVVPAGQYQSWKFFDESGKKWSNSIYESDDPIAFFWTSTDLGESSTSLFAKDGAKAISINSTGVYSEVRMPKAMGLPCRCISNN